MGRKTTLVRSGPKSSKRSHKLMPFGNKPQNKSVSSDAVYPQESKSLMAQIEKESFSENIPS
jgi:hypothetical protein